MHEQVAGQVILINEAELSGSIATTESVFTFTRADVGPGLVFNSHLVGCAVRFTPDGRTARNVEPLPFDKHARATAWASKHFGTKYRRY